MDMEFKLKGLDKLEKRLKKAQNMEPTKQAVKEAGAKAYFYANRNTPVDTRFLQRSEGLNIIDGGMTAEIYYSAQYGPYVEYGTRYMYGRYFLRRGIQQVKPEFFDKLKKAQSKQMSRGGD